MNAANNTFQRVLDNPQPFATPDSIVDYEELFYHDNKDDLQIRICWQDYPDGSTKAFEAELRITLSRTTPEWRAALYFNGKSYKTIRISISHENDFVDFEGFARVRIGIFPLMFESLLNTMYVGAHRNILDVGELRNPLDVKYYDVSIGRTFIENWRNLKTGTKKSQYELTRTVTEDIRRIFGYNKLEINATADSKTLQVIINDRTYRLPELGTGIAQFIVVLANAALRTPAYVLIDEPELNLHPSLQFDFLSSLASYSSRGVFFASHSLGLAVGYSDRVYSVRKDVDGSSQIAEYESTPRLSEFLGELSFSGYKELGFDKVLLVEGPTEVKVLQQWLRLYRLGHKIVVIHLGGGSSIHARPDTELQEITRISPHAFALIDSEIDARGKPLSSERQGFVEACRNAGINCRVTKRRATENYFTERAIKLALGNQYSALGEFELLKKARLSWSKRDNWRIAREMTLDEIEATDLHDFFVSLQQ